MNNVLWDMNQTFTLKDLKLLSSKLLLNLIHIILKTFTLKGIQGPIGPPGPQGPPGQGSPGSKVTC